MQIVIDIPEGYYDLLKGFDDEKCSMDMLLIKHGKPLPNGHGDLVDLKEMIDAFWDGNFMEIYEEDLEKIKVIIEADKEVDE